MSIRDIELFSSKRFWILVIGFGLLILVNVIPQTADNGELQQAILWLTGLAISGYSVQDALIALRGNSKYTQALFVAGEELVESTENTIDNELFKLVKALLAERDIGINEGVVSEEPITES